LEEQNISNIRAIAISISEHGALSLFGGEGRNYNSMANILIMTSDCD
jgi:hypothetical protein